LAVGKETAPHDDSSLASERAGGKDNRLTKLRSKVLLAPAQITAFLREKDMRAALSLCIAILVSTLGPSLSWADFSVTDVHITSLAQQTDYSMIVSTDTHPTGNCSTSSFPYYVATTNPASSTYPSYQSIAPLLMAAYLYGKIVTINIVCSSGYAYIQNIYLY
jgi:hypothetical protein